MVNCVYGPHDVDLLFDGLSVAEIQLALTDLLDMEKEPDALEVYLDGQLVRDRTGTRIKDKQRVEFMKKRGRKGGDLWSKREFKKHVQASESEWRWCLDQGLVPGEHEGITFVTIQQASEWHQKLIARRNGKLPKLQADWCHDPEEEPTDKFCYGPLLGTQTQVASWLWGKTREDGSYLKSLAKQGEVWVRRRHTRLYEVWFKDEGMYHAAAANEKKAKERPGME